MANLPNNSGADRNIMIGAQSCPFLGVYEDPQTHVAVADMRNYCHLMKPPQSIAISYQNAYCLNQNHQACEVFIRSSTQKKPTPQKHAPEKTKPQADKVTAQPNGEDLRNRLREEALRHYQDVKPRSNRVWLILLAAALVILIAVAVGFLLRYQQLQATAQQAAADNSYLSTAMYNIGSAADVVATSKAENNARENALATADSLTATAIAAIVEIPTLTNTPIALRATATTTATISAICQDVSLTSYEIATGPNLSPQQGYQQVVGTKIPPLTATWTIKNTGDCIWQKIALWSLNDNVIVAPTIVQNGNKLTSTTGGVDVTVAPGESVDVVVTERFTGRWRYQDEWILVINGLSLSAEPHLILDVKNWVIVLTSTPAPTTVVKPTKPAGSQVTAPASRPTATSSGGR